MLSSVFGKKKPDCGSNKIYAGLLKICQYGFAGCAADLCRTKAEVNVLKLDLERSERELGHAKKQLEDKEGE